jgi:hypothetical protein
MTRTSRRYVPFRPRRIERLGLLELAGTRLKHYAVIAGDRLLERSRFDRALPLVAAALPRPSVTAGRPGAGLLIFHQGPAVDYVVLGWWDRENELPIRVWLRDRGRWRKARRSESICVWDLEIAWFERCAWVTHVLNGDPVATGVRVYSTKWLPVQERAR